jgi:hypothetical protein
LEALKKQAEEGNKHQTEVEEKKESQIVPENESQASIKETATKL